MPRRGCLVLMLGLLTVSGCGGQGTPEPEPQNANRQAKAPDRKRSPDRTADQRKPTPSLSNKVYMLVLPFLRSHREVVHVVVSGDPSNPNTASEYQIRNLQPLKGPLPPAGT